MKLTSKKARRVALPLLLAGVLGLGVAVAARISLGTTGSLGAGTAAVSSCTANLDVHAEPVLHDTIDTTTGTYLVDTITITATDPAAADASASLAACDGQTYLVDVLGKTTPTAATTVLQHFSGTFDHTTLATTGLTPTTTLDAATIERISVVIKGTTAATTTATTTTEPAPTTTAAPTTTVAPGPVQSSCSDGVSYVIAPINYNEFFLTGGYFTSGDFTACNGKRFEITFPGDSGATVHVLGGPSWSQPLGSFGPGSSMVTSWTVNGTPRAIDTTLIEFAVPYSWETPSITFWDL